MAEYAAAVIVKVETNVQSHCWSKKLHDWCPSAVLYTGRSSCGEGLVSWSQLFTHFGIQEFSLSYV